MRAALFGIAAVTLAGIGFSAPASALPFAGVAPQDGLVEKTQMMSRRVMRGPRCRTVVTKRRGPLGRVVTVRKRRCF